MVLWIALEAVNQNVEVLQSVKTTFNGICCMIQYEEVVLAAAKKDVNALKYVNPAWALYFLKKVLVTNSDILPFDIFQKPEWYKEIVLVAVKEYGSALRDIDEAWVLANPKTYCVIALEAVNKNGMALQYVTQELKDDSKIVLAALSQNGKAFQYAGQVFRNDITIAISSLMDVERKDTQQYEVYFAIALAAVNQNFLLEDVNSHWALTVLNMFRAPCQATQNILLYLYIE